MTKYGEPLPPTNVGDHTILLACPIEDGAPSWDSAPDWALYLMCDQISYFWSTDWSFAQYRVSQRPKEPT